MKVWKKYNAIGREEIEAVNNVLSDGVLSSFVGAWGNEFYGGTQVKAFEREICDYFQCEYAVTFNSLTSGLIAAVGSLGISPGDEVIVSPWTMSATATAIVIWGGIPVFADIETTYFGIDPVELEKLISPKTKAIIVTDIFGHGAMLDEIVRIADKWNIPLIEDAAQSPGVKYKGKYCGTWGKIGGFSLNYHKHIHTGEGGFCITNDKEIALKMQLIRNHGESSVVGSPLSELKNIIGFNFRMGEIEATIGRQQLKKLKILLSNNVNQAETFIDRISDATAIELPIIEIESTHAFYVLPMKINTSNRKKWIDDIHLEGIPGIFSGYMNVHRLPMYENKIAFGNGYPWSISDKQYQYGKGTCRQAESLQDESFVGFLISMYELSMEDINYITKVMIKSWQKLN